MFVIKNFDPLRQILFEDNHIIIINKFTSQIVQGDKTGDQPLSEAIQSYLKDTYNKPGNVFIGVVHRLDRPVSGIVIFAKTSKALSRLNILLQEHQIHKTYWAVVGNAPQKKQGQLVDYLVKNEKENKSYRTKPDRKNAKKAILDYRLIGQSKRYFLLEVILHTGRHHQIRVQLSGMGCTIKGDVKYGFPRKNPGPYMHLHARNIQFTHPVSKEEINITAPLPREPIWNLFNPDQSKPSPKF